MGFAASQARYMMLTARKSDLEFIGQSINQARLMIANTVGQLFNITANLDPDSRVAIALQSQIAALQTQDKALELQLRRVDTQREAVTTELEAVRKVIAKNIQMSFKIFA